MNEDKKVYTQPPQSQMVVPPGYVLVPIKPTKDMAYQAACYFYGKRLVDIAGGIDGISMANRSGERSFWFAFKKFWRAALANAPQPSCPPPAENVVGAFDFDRWFDDEIIEGRIPDTCGGANTWLRDHMRRAWQVGAGLSAKAEQARCHFCDTPVDPEKTEHWVQDAYPCCEACSPEEEAEAAEGTKDA